MPASASWSRMRPALRGCRTAVGLRGAGCGGARRSAGGMAGDAGCAATGVCDLHLGPTGRPRRGDQPGALSLHLDDFIATYDIGAADTVLHFATVNFDASLDQLLPALTMGGRVVMRAPMYPDSE